MTSTTVSIEPHTCVMNWASASRLQRLKMRFWLHMHAEYHGQQVTTSYHHWPFLFKLPHHEPYGEEVKFVVKAMRYMHVALECLLREEFYKTDHSASRFMCSLVINVSKSKAFCQYVTRVIHTAL